MSDGILNGLDPATLAEHFGEVDLEYTWLQEQTPSEAETLRAELQFQRQQVKDLSATAEYYRALVQEARDERDAAITECIRRTGIEQDVQHYKERAEQAERERDAAIEDVREMIGEMEHESNMQHAVALDLQAQRDAAVADAKKYSAAILNFVDVLGETVGAKTYYKKEFDTLRNSIKQDGAK